MSRYSPLRGRAALGFADLGSVAGAARGWNGQKTAEDIGRDTVPHQARRRWLILQSFQATSEVAIKGPVGNAELVQRALSGQVRLLDDPDDLELLGSTKQSLRYASSTDKGGHDDF